MICQFNNWISSISASNAVAICWDSSSPFFLHRLSSTPFVEERWAQAIGRSHRAPSTMADVCNAGYYGTHHWEGRRKSHTGSGQGSGEEWHSWSWDTGSLLEEFCVGSTLGYYDPPSLFDIASILPDLSCLCWGKQHTKDEIHHTMQASWWL